MGIGFDAPPGSGRMALCVGCWLAAVRRTTSWRRWLPARTSEHMSVHSIDSPVEPSPAPELARRYAVRGEAAIEDFDEGSLVLLGQRLRMVLLNPTAREVIGWLDGQRTVDQVAAVVAGRYGVPPEQALNDVLGLLWYLERRGVVERCNTDMQA